MKKLLWPALIALLLTSLILTSCGKGALVPETTEITVGTYALWPPYEAINAQSKNIEGLDIDIFNAIAAKEDFSVTYKNSEWDPLLSGMGVGMFDAAISSITITDELKKDMLFSDPYFSAGQVIVIRNNNTTIKGKDTLTGLVGVQKDSKGDIEVQKIKSAKNRPYDTIVSAFQDLLDDKIQAVVCENPVALIYVGKFSDKIKTVGPVFTEEQYGIAVAKSKPDLLKKINSGLKSVKSEGLDRSVFQKMVEDR